MRAVLKVYDRLFVGARSLQRRRSFKRFEEKRSHLSLINHAENGDKRRSLRSFRVILSVVSRETDRLRARWGTIEGRPFVSSSIGNIRVSMGFNYFPHRSTIRLVVNVTWQYNRGLYNNERMITREICITFSQLINSEFVCLSNVWIILHIFATIVSLASTRVVQFISYYCILL